MSEQEKPVDVAAVRRLPVEHVFMGYAHGGSIAKVAQVYMTPRMRDQLCDEVDRLRSSNAAREAAVRELVEAAEALNRTLRQNGEYGEHMYCSACGADFGPMSSSKHEDDCTLARLRAALVALKVSG